MVGASSCSGFDPSQGMYRRQPIHVSLSLSLPLFLKSINMSSDKDYKKKERKEEKNVPRNKLGGPRRRRGRWLRDRREED